MALSEYAGSSSGTTISTTEYSLVGSSGTLTPQTTKGVYQCWLDLNAMALGDQFELKVYDKIISGATQRVAYDAIFTDAQSQPLIIIPSLLLFWGWDFTLKKLTGTDRSIGWSIRQVA